MVGQVCVGASVGQAWDADHPAGQAASRVRYGTPGNPTRARDGRVVSCCQRAEPFPLRVTCRLTRLKTFSFAAPEPQGAATADRVRRYGFRR